MASNTEIIIALLLIQNLSCCEEAEQKDGEMCYSVHAVKSLCSFWKKSVGDPAAALVQFDFSRFLGESDSDSVPCVVSVLWDFRRNLQNCFKEMLPGI